MLYKRKNETVSVVVPCHNYAHFLAECLQSIIGQTIKPLEIIVVDDDSSDKPEQIVSKFSFENLRILKVNNRNIAKTQANGIEYAQGDYVCCIDGDDTIDPFYLEEGLKKFEEDYRIGIVYSDFEYRGLMQGISNFPDSSLFSDINIRNFIHTGSIFKREIALFTESFKHPECDKYLNDWHAWKKILKEGYWAVKQNSKYIYRRHEGSYSVSNDFSYYEAALLSYEHVTMVIFVDDMQYAWADQEKFLMEQTWPRDQISLVIMYSGMEENNFELRNKLLNLPYADVQFVALHLPDKISPREREYEIASRVAIEVDSLYFIYVDEFVVPPNDLVKKLFLGMCENTVSVCSDFSGISCKIASLLKMKYKKTRNARGIQKTAGNSFLSILIRSEYFKNAFSIENMNRIDINSLSPEDYFYSNTSKSFFSKVHCDVLSSFVYDKDQAENLLDKLEEYFDEKHYLSMNADVAEAVKEGKYKSGFQHYKMYGATEGREYRKIGKIFDEVYYLKSYPDVRKVIEEGNISSGYEHYLLYGEKEGRHAFFY
jgi:glycosyltransferase involved in cell wall biosynthesis